MNSSVVEEEQIENVDIMTVLKKIQYNEDLKETFEQLEEEKKLPQVLGAKLGPIGMNLLHYAVSIDQKKSMKTLLKYFDVNSRDNDDNTTLHYVQSIQTAFVLLALKADINAKNKQQQSVLYFPIANHNFQLVKFLIENGIDLEKVEDLPFKKEFKDKSKFFTQLWEYLNDI